MCENCERLRGELADVRCQFSIMDSLRKTEKSRAEKAESALAESLAREAAKDEALAFYADRDEHHSFLGFDVASGSRYLKDAYHEKARAALSQPAKTGEQK